MNRRRWRELATRFEAEVTDTPRSDVRGVLRQVMKDCSRGAGRKTLVDLGCGQGTLLRRHGRPFRRVVGVDFAEAALKVAARRCRGLKNAEWVCADAAGAGHNDLVVQQQVFVLCQALRQVLRQPLQQGQELRRDVLGHAADAHVVRRQAGAAGHLEQVQDLLPLP